MSALDQASVVYRWDLDKTYLLSEFESLREMMRIPFERPEDKVAAPGVAALIRGLRTAALGRGRGVRVYFLSASPPQIGRAIRRKLELDTSVQAWADAVRTIPRVRELALTADVAIRADALTMHADPADRFIVASALAQSAPLLTKDRLLRKLDVLRTVW